MKNWWRWLMAALALAGTSAQCTKSKWVWRTEEEFYALPIWYEKAERMAKIERDSGTATLFIGDSMTEGFDVVRFFEDSEMVNMGIGGDFTSGVLRRLDAVIRLHPRKVFVMIGINDIMKRTPTQRTMDNYQRILETLRLECPETEVYVQSCLPLKGIGGPGVDNDDLVTEVRALNAWLKEQCALLGAHYVDLYPLFEAEGRYLNPSLTYDGIHLNESGNRVWAEAIRPLVKGG